MMVLRATTLAVISIASGWLGYQFSDRNIPTVIHDMQPSQPVVSAGDKIRFEYRSTRLRSCETHVDRFIFLPSTGIRLVLPPLDFPAGVLPVGDDPFATMVDIPADAPEGRALYRTLNSYVCNFTHYIWPIVDKPRDIYFQIIK